MSRSQALVKNHPRFAEGHLFLCRILCSDSDGDLELAAVHYRAALEIDPQLAEPALDRDLGELLEGGELSEAGDSETLTFGQEPAAEDPSTEDWISPGDEAPTDSPFEFAQPEESESGYVDGGFIEALQRGMDQNGIRVSDLDAPTTNFNDVGGLYGLKEDLRMKIVHPVKNPQLFQAYGISAGGSMLLYGPPGCGKTMIAEALEGEVNASLYKLSLHQLHDTAIGRAEKHLHEIFHIARMNAPSVLFLDEVDAIASRRAGAADPARPSLVNQLLNELDDLSKGDDGVLVIAATSAPWLLDPAFHRAGRFDSKIFISTPDEADRIDIIRVLRNRIPVSDLDAQAVAAATAGFSGAELTAVFENAAERAIAASLKVGCFQPLTTALLIDEAKSYQPGAAAWMSIAREEAEKARMADSFRGLYES